MNYTPQIIYAALEQIQNKLCDHVYEEESFDLAVIEKIVINSLREAGLSQGEISRLTGLCVRTIRYKLNGPTLIQ